MKDLAEFQPGVPVQWKWKGGFVKGEIIEVYHEPVRKELKGKWIKRNGSVQKPAYLVKSLAGNFALKLITELELR